MSTGDRSPAQLQAEITELQNTLEESNTEKADLELLLETITEHATNLENQILASNKQMANYIKQVEKLTAAASAVENNTFQPASLTTVSDRSDELGHLARVFLKMVEQVQAREQYLQSQVQELRIEIDRVKADRQVSEIVDSEAFAEIKRKFQQQKKAREAKQATENKE